jgi:hypothetical protein
MDRYIDGRFERLEKALTNLIDSVAKYNPSVAQAKELSNADQDLYVALEEGRANTLSIHFHLPVEYGPSILCFPFIAMS